MTSRVIDQPAPGFFLCRFVKLGPWVPCEIRHEPTRDPETDEMLDRSWWWTTFVCGEQTSPPSIEPSDNVWSIWHGGRAIDEARYSLLVEQCRWDRTYKPDSPLANPFRPVVLAEIEPSTLF